MRIRPRNWDSFQHYKNRRPPWIKLHHTLIDDVNFHALKGEDAKHLIMIWLIASEDFGYLPENPELAFRLRMTVKQLEQLLARLQAWIAYDASKPLAPCKQDATPETETETEEETEKDASASIPDSVDNRVLCETLGIFGMREQADVLPLLVAYVKSSGKSIEQAVEHIAGRWEFCKSKSAQLEWQWGSAYKFLMSGKWDDVRSWPWREGCTPAAEKTPEQIRAKTEKRTAEEQKKIDEFWEWAKGRDESEEALLARFPSMRGTKPAQTEAA